PPPPLYTLSLHDALPISRAPLRRKEFSPGFRQVCRLDFAGDAAFKVRLKSCARSVNHDYIFRTFGPNRMRDARRNHDSDVIAAADRKSTRLNSSHVAISY